MAEKAPSILIEPCGKQDSGFIKDGTEHSAHPEGINYAGAFFIPVTGFRKKEIIDAKGRKTVINEPIRYIKNCPTIVVEEQNRLGFLPNKNTDIINIEKGFATIIREGDIALYDYITEVSYRKVEKDDPFPKATKLFSIINIDANSEKFVEKEIAWLETGAYLAELQIKRGSKYEFKEERIEAIISLLAIPVPPEENTPMGKFSAIMRQAKHDPVEFMKKVMKLEQASVIMVNHAIELEVIKFDGNTAVYVEQDEVLLTLGAGRFKNEQRIEKVAEFLNDPANEEILKIFQARLEYAKEKQLTT